jgi:hypothetical protein
LRKTITLLCWLSVFFAFAQKTKQQPEFIGGVAKFMTFIAQNYRYPEQMIKANVSGRTVVKFRITERGMVDIIQIIKSPGFGTNEEIIRVLKLTSEKWKPGRIHGKSVAMFYYLPLNIDPE